MNSIVGNLSSSDKDRWTYVKQKELFNQLKEINTNLHNEVYNTRTSMNGHSLDMLNIFVDTPWKEIKKDKYLMGVAFADDRLFYLMLRDSDFLTELDELEDSKGLIKDKVKKVKEKYTKGEIEIKDEVEINQL